MAPGSSQDQGRAVVLIPGNIQNNSGLLHRVGDLSEELMNNLLKYWICFARGGVNIRVFSE